MALTTAQRNALPRSAFVIRSGPRSAWRYPIPTRAQARAAGISERQRITTHRAALAYSARRDTKGSHARIRPVVARRHGGAVKSVRRTHTAAGRPRARSGR